MIDVTVLAARRHSELHPGYHLVAATDAAIPFSWLTLDVLAQEQKPLPVIDEFVLRLCSGGVNTIADVAAVLGMDDDTVRDAVAQQLSAETLDYRPDPRPDHHGQRTITLTPDGTRAAEHLKTTTPQRIELVHAFDRLLWSVSSHTKNDLILRDAVTAAGMLLLPSSRTHDVTAQEITPRILNRTLLDTDRADNDTPTPARRRAGGRGAEVLSVEEVIRQQRRYLPAVLLIYAADTFDDIRLTLVLDDLSSPDHDHALAQAGGAEKLGISVEPPLGEPDLPAVLLHQRVPYDTVRGLQRRADATAADPPAAGTRTPPDNDSATARAELDAMTVRSVPAFEHRELLADALDHARHRFLLITATLRDAVLTDDFMARLESMLRRKGITAHIAYGLGTPESDQDTGAVTRLRRLAERHTNLTVTRLDHPHPHVLIADDTWINTSFGWLSYRGNRSPVYRREEGTLIRATEVVNERHALCVTAIESS